MLRAHRADRDTQVRHSRQSRSPGGSRLRGFYVTVPSATA
jgi:hypothetical protein